MSNKTIFGLPVDLLSASNMTVTTSAPDGKYVLKSGDTMSGDLKMEDGAGIYVDGQLEVKDESKFGRKVTMDHDLEVKSIAQFGGEVTAAAGLVVSHDCDVGGLLTAQGGSVFHDLMDVIDEAKFRKKVTMNQDLEVNGISIYYGNVYVHANGYFGDLLEASGGASVSGFFESTDGSTFWGNVTMHEDVEMKKDLKVEGKINVNEPSWFHNDLTVHGHLGVDRTITAFEEAKVAGLLSAEPDIDKYDLVADPTVGVEVVGKITMDPVTKLPEASLESLGAAPSSTGWNFTLGSSHDLLVTHLLYIAEGFTSGTRDVAIWEHDTGNLVVQATVASDDPADPFHNWRVHALDEKDYKVLEAGRKYIIAGFTPTASEYMFLNPIAEVDSRYFSDGPWGMYKQGTPTLEMPDHEIKAHLVQNVSFYCKVAEPTAQILYSGLPRLPFQPTIAVSRSESQSITEQEPTTITWDLVRWASKGEHKMRLAHNNAFIEVPVTGLYLVSYTIVWDAGESGTKKSQVWVNSDPDKAWASLSVSNNVQEFYTVTDQVMLQAQDTLQLVVEHDGASSTGCMGAPVNGFTVTLLYAT